VGIRIAAKSLERMKRKVRHLTRRSQGNSWEKIRDGLRRAITGWVNYYALTDTAVELSNLDAWLRRRMRQVTWVAWKTGQNRYKRLTALGVSESWAMRIAGSSKGAWRISKSQPLQQALSNSYWHRVGLVSFIELYNLRRT
jgi:hypothetical protein